MFLYLFYYFYKCFYNVVIYFYIILYHKKLRKHTKTLKRGGGTLGARVPTQYFIVLNSTKTPAFYSLVLLYLYCGTVVGQTMVL